MKDSAILKKALAGDGYWAMVKEIMGWVINTHRGTLVLSSKLRIELLSLLEIPTIWHHILVNNLERLIDKLHSMHLAVPGGIGNFFTMQVTLTCARSAMNATANLSNRFH